MCLSGQKGNTESFRGYWGDIVSSPYLAYGVETDDNRLLKKQNNQHIKVKCHILFYIGTSVGKDTQNSYFRGSKDMSEKMTVKYENCLSKSQIINITLVKKIHSRQ